MDDWVKLEDLKKGQVVYECEFGLNTQLTATEDAYVGSKYGTTVYICKTVAEDGREVELSWNPKYPAYQPKLYTRPQYGEVGRIAYQKENRQLDEEYERKVQEDDNGG